MTEGKWGRAFYRAPFVNGICVHCSMLGVSVCSVAGPVLCIGSLGVVSVRHARYPHVRTYSYVYLWIRKSLVRLWTSFSKRILTLICLSFVRASCGVRADSNPYATCGAPPSLQAQFPNLPLVGLASFAQISPPCFN